MADTIIDLGRKVKAKYPEYGDMPDEEVGRRVKTKFPGEYDDFIDITPGMEQLGGTPPGVPSPTLPVEMGGPAPPGTFKIPVISDMAQSIADIPTAAASIGRAPIKNEKAKGQTRGSLAAGNASRVIGGVATAATAMLPEAILNAPIRTLLSLGAGGAAKAGTSMIPVAPGNEGYRDVVGDAVGLGAGLGTNRVTGKVADVLSGIPVREPLARFWDALQANKNNPATQDAILGQLPYVGPKFKAIISTFPKPPESIAPRSHWPPSAELPRSQPIKPGPAPPSAELPRSITPPPEEPKVRLHWPPSAEMPQATSPEAPQGRPNWPPSAELPRSQAPRQGPPPPSAELPRGNQPPGKPPGKPHWPPKAELPRPPIDPEEAAIQEQIAKQKAGTLLPPPPAATGAPFGVKAGEGTHLNIKLKEGQLPAKADYETGARNLWANHMHLRLKMSGKTLSDLDAMSTEEVDSIAKDLGINKSSEGKLAILRGLMGGK